MCFTERKKNKIWFSKSLFPKVTSGKRGVVLYSGQYGTSDELDKAVGSLSLDKYPGSDCLPDNFYKHFWSLLKELFLLMLKEATETMTFLNLTRTPKF